MPRGYKNRPEGKVKVYKELPSFNGQLMVEFKTFIHFELEFSGTETVFCFNDDKEVLLEKLKKYEENN